MTLTTGTIDPSRTRWQYLFPEGLREEYPRDNGKVSVTTYTPAWCKGIVDRFRRFQRASEAYGMPAQPLPVQIQHVGVHGIGSPEDRRRVGSIYDLAYVPRGGAIPGGVWALIEWTAEGLDMINSGALNCLSPTNSNYGTLSTGEKIPGDFLIEVSLVDVPFLESIGTAADYLPFDAIPYMGSRSMSSAATPATSRSYPAAWFAAHVDGTVISRGAKFRSAPMENEEKVEFELSPDKLTPAVVEAIMASDTARAKMRECMRELMVSDLEEALATRGYMNRAKVREMMESELDALLEARGMKKREVASPTLPEVESVVSDGLEQIEAKARAIEDVAISDEVTELTRGRKLLPSQVREFVARRRSGAPVGDLIRDWSLASAMTGVQGVTPREQSQPVDARRTADDISAEVERELRSRSKYSYREHLAIAKERIETARSKGALLEV